MPCKHAIAAIVFKRERLEDHCHSLITMASYNKTDMFQTGALPGEEYWEGIDQMRPLSPMIKKKTGRPKKNRKKTSEEPMNPIKLKRKLREFTCTTCGEKKSQQTNMSNGQETKDGRVSGPTSLSKCYWDFKQLGCYLSQPKWPTRD